MWGATGPGRNRNQCISLGVTNIDGKTRENGWRRFGHAERRNNGEEVEKIRGNEIRRKSAIKG